VVHLFYTRITSRDSSYDLVGGHLSVFPVSLSFRFLNFSLCEMQLRSIISHYILIVHLKISFNTSYGLRNTLLSYSVLSYLCHCAVPISLQFVFNSIQNRPKLLLYHMYSATTTKYGSSYFRPFNDAISDYIAHNSRMI
jgi:hypothetical protein